LGPIGFWGVRAGGLYYAYGVSSSSKTRFDWDMDSVPAIDAGAAYARQEGKTNGTGQCDCP
jgi:hypothetical protein